MIFKYTCVQPEELKEIAVKMLEDAGSHNFFALYGNMGAGKTTLVKELCTVLGALDVVSSPTYAIMNEYHTRSGTSIFHFDFYRLKNISEAYDLGYENYFFSNSFCFVEWPEKIESLLDFPKASIFITSENNQRIIELHTEDQQQP
ncbi:MAG: tRNA (adenosine(37)-N6)-threonylcarbamoyltransferase complex ATPase subunit type 1 TsaE [Bacteroidota bacterium]